MTPEEGRRALAGVAAEVFAQLSDADAARELDGEDQARAEDQACANQEPEPDDEGEGWLAEWEWQRAHLSPRC